MRFKEAKKVPGLVVRVLEDGDLEIDASRVPSPDPPEARVEATTPEADADVEFKPTACRIRAIVTREGPSWRATAVEVRAQGFGETAYQAVQHLSNVLIDGLCQGSFMTEYRRHPDDVRLLNQRLQTLKFHVKLYLAQPYFLHAFVDV